MAFSCKKAILGKDDALSLQRTDYMGNQIRVDGYYYYEYNDPQDFIDVYFLFRNGIILYGSTFKRSELDVKEIEYQTTKWQAIVKESKFRWGVFKVKNNSIQFERWYPSDPPLKAYIHSGEIINDTTFVITESYRMKNGEKTEEEVINEVYHFKQFRPKPDSTNNFIK